MEISPNTQMYVGLFVALLYNYTYWEGRAISPLFFSFFTFLSYLSAKVNVPSRSIESFLYSISALLVSCWGEDLNVLILFLSHLSNDETRISLSFFKYKSNKMRCIGLVLQATNRFFWVTLQSQTTSILFSFIIFLRKCFRIRWSFVTRGAKKKCKINFQLNF